MTSDIQKALAFLEAGDAGRAAALLGDTLDRLPEYATAHVVLARAREALGEWDRALHAWREALRLVPTSPAALRGLAGAARKAHEPPQETDPFADIDRLISRLESARIDSGSDAANAPAPDLEDDIEDVVSETLAEIYAAQQRYGEAARIYEALAGQRPGQAEAFREKAIRLRSKAAGDTEKAED